MSLATASLSKKVLHWFSNLQVLSDSMCIAINLTADLQTFTRDVSPFMCPVFSIAPFHSPTRKIITMVLSSTTVHAFSFETKTMETITVNSKSHFALQNNVFEIACL